MSANQPQKAPKIPRICAQWPPTAPNQKETIPWATWLKMRFRAHLIHPQPPTFGGFHPLKLPSPMPRPRYLSPLGCSKLRDVAQRGGCPNGSRRSTGCEKITFFKNDLGPHGMPKQVFSARLELVVARFGPPKSPKCLENGLLWDKKNGSKMGQKCVFLKMILDHLGCLNK